jgi:2-oxoglutarate ferredoxin oxidoreductase subunit beta
VQIYQNCNIFNDGAFEELREKKLRDDNLLLVEHGKPLVFGAQRERGIRLDARHHPEVVTLGNGISEADLLVHDEQGPPGYVAMLAALGPPAFPVAVGVLSRVSDSCFDEALNRQSREVTERLGAGDLERAIAGGTTWTVSG